MTLKTRLSEREFINSNFVVLYSKLSVKIVTGIILLFFLASLLSVLFIPKVSFSQLLVPLAMLAAFPLTIFFAARKNYSDNKRISEYIEYQFEKDNLHIKGESFTTQLSWEKIHKVTQTKNWILIWHNNQIANPIHKRDITDSQISEIKQILDEKKVRNNL